MMPHDTIPWIPYPDQSDDERVANARAFYETIATRRSCRQIGSAPAPRAVIESAILAAGTAPSGANHQPWHFAVIGSRDLKRAVRIAAEEEEREFYAGKAGNEWLESLAPLGTDAAKPYLSEAPWLIVIFGQRKGGLYPGRREAKLLRDRKRRHRDRLFARRAASGRDCNAHSHAQSDAFPEPHVRSPCA